MPGEDAVYKPELYVFHRGTETLHSIAGKWKDESYQDLAFDKEGTLLRFCAATASCGTSSSAASTRRPPRCESS